MLATLERAQSTENIAVEEEIQRIYLLSPREQFMALDPGGPYSQYRLPAPRDLSVGSIDSLVDFAADSQASSSLLVRAQALELALEALVAQDAEVVMPGADPELNKRYCNFDALMPSSVDLSNKSGISALARNPSLAADTLGLDNPARPYNYRQAVMHLIEWDALDYNLVFPDWNVLGSNASEYDDSVPTAALLALDRLVEIRDTPHLLPHSSAAKLVPLALDIQAALTKPMGNEDITRDQNKELRADAEAIMRFEALDHPQKEQYHEALRDLYHSAFSLPIAFPPEYAAGVKKGAASLLNQALYAVVAHLENGDTSEIAVPINGNPDNLLELSLGGDEPLEIMHAITQAIKTINSLATSPQTRTSQVTRASQYSLFRLWDSESGQNPASVYIRPLGDESYDDAIEYGRNGEGVEASISYVVDTSLKPGELIEVGKHRCQSADNRISIRLDREGQLAGSTERDPTQYQGTLSLDIGSVLGDPAWLSTKAGRFLAWGNLLRSQQIGTSPGLNHVRRYFIEEDGRADTFASRASTLTKQLEKQLLSKKEISSLLSGRSAVSALHHAK